MRNHKKLNSRLLPKLRRARVLTFEDSERAAWGGRGGEGGGVGFALGIVCLSVIVAVTSGVIAFAYRDKLRSNIESMLSSKGDATVAITDAGAAKGLIRNFVELTTIESRLELVRPSQSLEARMLKHYALHPPRNGSEIEFSGQHWEAAHDGQNDIIWINYRSSGDPGSPWFTAVVEKTPDGLRLDWESFVSYEEQPLEKFGEGLTESSQIFRVAIYPGDYYNYLYQDAETFQAFQIRNVRQQSCWAYVRRKSAVFKELERLFSAELDRRSAFERVQPWDVSLMLTLQLSNPANSDGRVRSQLLIEEVVSESWFVP